MQEFDPREQQTLTGSAFFRLLNWLDEGADSDGRKYEEMRAREESTLGCLEQCIDKLETRSREIILRYYVGKQRVKIENRFAQPARKPAAFVDSRSDLAWSHATD